MSASRSGTRDTSMSSPTSPFDAISDDEDDSPAAPRSCSEASVSASSSSRQHSTSFDSSKGSPIWTEGRLAESPSPSSALASTEAPPIPSRPVRAPSRTSRLPTPAAALRIRRSSRREPDAHRVDEAVLLVGGLEVHLAAHGRHTDRVAVVADALDGPVEEVARARRVELAETQGVEHRDRPRPDREHVAQDAPDPRGRALKRLDRARVVVRLDLEGHREPVPDVHHARVLAGAHQQVRPLDRKLAQQLLRMLVGAVLRPHQREHGQLQRVRVAPEALADAVVLGVRQPEVAMGSREGAAHTIGATASVSDSNSRPPSADPVSGSTACSG